MSTETSSPAVNKSLLQGGADLLPLLVTAGDPFHCKAFSEGNL